MAAPDDAVTATKRGVMLRVTAQPRSPRPGVAELRNGALVVRVKAAPDKGRANAEIVALLAKFLGAAKSDLDIAAGATSRHKKVLIRGADPDRIRKILRDHSQST